MKKYLALLFATVLIICMAACNTASKPLEDVQPDPQDANVYVSTDHPETSSDSTCHCEECMLKARELSPMIINSMSEAELYRKMNCSKLLNDDSY